MKILFLDIDGVLNCTETFRRRHAAWLETKEPTKDPLRFGWPMGHLDEDLIPLLNSICEQTDCNIVISSTWRKLAELNDLKRWLNQKGFLYPEKIIDITPTFNLRVSENQRGVEIQAWLDTNKDKGISAYCILDDDGFDIVNIHPFNYVPTRFCDGITIEEVKLAIAMLNR